MAAVQLKAVWFNVVADPSDSLALRHVTGFSRVPEKPGEIVRGAGGRVRFIRQAGRSVEWSLGFKVLTPAQKQWLEDRIGELMCFRDDRGHKIFGVYQSVDVTERLYNHEGDVSLSVTELTYSEAV